MAAIGQQSREHGRAGFTLIEIMVVLAITSALVLIALVSLTPIFTRLRGVYERDDIERQLAELPLRVRLSGRGGILVSHSADRSPTTRSVAVEGALAWGAAIENWQVLRFSLPDGWSLRVDSPIFYHLNGSCDGGEVEFTLPPVSLRYRLTPPLCRPIAAEPAGAT